MSTELPAHPHNHVPAAGTPPVRPGWPEIVVGLLSLVAVTFTLLFFGPRGLDLDPVPYGLVVAAWSGIGGLIGFAVAAVVRVRSLSAFSVRRTTWRWMLIGVAGGVAAVVTNQVVVRIAMALGFESDPQGVYSDAAGGGVLALILTTLFLSILTPIGEEFLFRGVITNALLRYGPITGVLASSVIFALFHGINIVLPAALVVGVITAEVMRRSGSIWPAVAVHVVNNLVLPLMVVFTGEVPS